MRLMRRNIFSVVVNCAVAVLVLVALATTPNVIPWRSASMYVLSDATATALAVSVTSNAAGGGGGSNTTALVQIAARAQRTQRLAISVGWRRVCVYNATFDRVTVSATHSLNVSAHLSHPASIVPLPIVQTVVATPPRPLVAWSTMDALLDATETEACFGFPATDASPTHAAALGSASSWGGCAMVATSMLTRDQAFIATMLSVAACLVLLAMAGEVAVSRRAMLQSEQTGACDGRQPTSGRAVVVAATAINVVSGALIAGALGLFLDDVGGRWFCAYGADGPMPGAGDACDYLLYLGTADANQLKRVAALAADALVDYVAPATMAAATTTATSPSVSTPACMGCKASTGPAGWLLVAACSLIALKIVLRVVFDRADDALAAGSAAPLRQAVPVAPTRQRRQLAHQQCGARSWLRYNPKARHTDPVEYDDGVMVADPSARGGRSGKDGVVSPASDELTLPHGYFTHASQLDPDTILSTSTKPGHHAMEPFDHTSNTSCTTGDRRSGVARRSGPTSNLGEADSLQRALDGSTPPRHHNHHAFAQQPQQQVQQPEDQQPPAPDATTSAVVPEEVPLDDEDPLFDSNPFDFSVAKWTMDPDTGLFWSRQLMLFFNPFDRRYFDPRSSEWYDSIKDVPSRPTASTGQ